MARNRKRAKERRARRPQPVATARTEPDDTIDPIRHATPDVELAEAQMALGRPELADSEVADSEVADPDEIAAPEGAEPELSEAEFRSEEDLADAGDADGFDAETGYDEVELSDAGGGRGGGAGAGADGLDEGAGDGERPAAHPAERARRGNRLINFLQGSWRELQRVQWPDRRQVIQATGVVIGFVIVAGVYLGVADTVASHLMDWVLK